MNHNITKMLNGMIISLNKQINGKPEYYKLSNGDYRKYTGKERVLIPIEIDRLEYLISYCLKNYYIKHANFVPNGDFVPKWMYENTQKSSNLDFNGHRDRIRDLEEDLVNMTEARNYYKDKYKKLDEFYEASKCFDDSMYEGRDDRVKELENKLQSIIRTARH